MTQEELINLSFELAAEKCEDLTPLVYERLFREQPAMKDQFWQDKSHQVKGEMLSRVVRAILDFVGERLYAATLIQCEVITHAGYDVPPDVFATFFGVVARTVKDVVGEAWTAEMDAAWAQTLEELDYYVKHPDQSETAAAAKVA